MNVLYVNLTRFGDLLQSAAAVHALSAGRDDGQGDGSGSGQGSGQGHGQNDAQTRGRKGKQSGEAHRAGLVCLDNFAAGAELLPGVDAIYPLAAGTIVAAMDPSRGGRPETAWMNGAAELRAWVRKVRDHFAPDEVRNLSPTLASCHLSRLLAGDGPVAGFAVNAHGAPENTTPWATFMQGSSASRAASPFNVVDLFRRVAGDQSHNPDGSLLPPPSHALDVMREALRAASPPGTRGYAALQLGASADIRRWPVAFFARAGDALWERHRLLPLLLGSSGEIPLAGEYAAAACGPHHSLAGKTSITDLAAVLTLSSLLISNDTGTLHLASGLGVPVVGIFLATAQAWDTGPYAVGSCSLEPDLPCHPCGFSTVCGLDRACHAAVRPETVLALAGMALAEQAETPDPATLAARFSPDAFAPEVFTGSRAWLTTRDECGFADLTSLSGHGNDARTHWMRVQRHVYRQFFDRNADEPFLPVPVPENPAVSGPENAALAEACRTMTALYDALAQQAEMLSANAPPVVRDRFWKNWDRLGHTLASRPEFAALALVWRSETASREDFDGILLLLRQYRALFLALQNALS